MNFTKLQISIIIISFLTTGLCIGWLVGLSMSPVVAGVISAIFAITTTALTIFLNQKASSDLDDIEYKKSLCIYTSILIATLMIGIATGSSIGTKAREYNLLGISEIERHFLLKKEELDLTKKFLEENIFENYKSVLTAEKYNEIIGKKQITGDNHAGLYSSKEISSKCDDLKYSTDENLIALIESSQDTYAEYYKALQNLKNKGATNKEKIILIRQYIVERCA